MPWFHHSSSSSSQGSSSGHPRPERSHTTGHFFGAGSSSHLSSGEASPFASAPSSRSGSPAMGSSFGHPILPPASDFPPGEPMATPGDDLTTPHAESQGSSYFNQRPLTPSSTFFSVGGQSSAGSSLTSHPLSGGGIYGLTGSSTNPALFQAQPLEIQLENDHLVLRGQGGDSNPALLSGSLVLNLSESTNIRELSLKLEGKAKIAFVDTSGGGNRNHHFTHPILSHDWSFLQGDKKHSHTLKAGRHAFPFSFTFDGNLPSSIRTYDNDANIVYRLRAVAIRSTFSTNFHAQRNVYLSRSFTAEALEFNQTLEIENTWPGKVMYCLTLPHKAYAAGDEIPVSLKFMPLAKGVKVTSITSVIKEYSIVHTRHSSHAEARVAATTKHEIRDGRAYRVNERGMDAVAPPHHGQEDNSANWNGLRSVPPSTPGSPSHRAVRDGSLGAVTPVTPMSDLSRAVSSVSLSGMAHAAGSSSVAGPSGLAGSSNVQVAELPDDMREPELEVGDDEINTMITIPIPSWTTPSHAIHPVQVTHKIKWSCAISNPDGHVSELRCALPIHILAHSLLDEARSASSGTRALLFGRGEGDEAPQIDLPSYNDHVYDRVANATAGPAASYVPSGYRSAGAGTPPMSRGPSRPGSPTRGMSYNNLQGMNNQEVNLDGDDAVPDRPELNWADSELLLSLGSLAGANNSSHPTSGSNSPHQTPPESRTHSRPGSRLGIRGRSSQPNSRGNSRASSPDRQTLHAGHNSNGSSTPATSVTGDHGPEVVRPIPERRQSQGLPGLFHLPSMSGLHIKPFTAIGGRQLHRGMNGISGTQSMEHSPTHSPLHSPSLQAAQMSTSLPRAGFSLGSHQAFTALAEQGHAREYRDHIDPISQVPSYDIASQGFLGGGVVPIDAGPPTYDDSERMLQRTRSDTALHQLDHTSTQQASLAAAAAELRQSAAHLDTDGPGADGTPASLPAPLPAAG